MPASKISIEQAKTDKLFYFVVNAMIYRESDQRCLLLKRGDQEKAHPGVYATVGGKLEWNDLDLAKPSRVNGEVLDFEHAIDDLIRREIKEEAGIEVAEKLHYLGNLAFVRPDGIPVVMLSFAATYASGEVVPEAGAFSDFAWVTAEEAAKLPCIDGVPKEVATTIELFQSLAE